MTINRYMEVEISFGNEYFSHRVALIRISWVIILEDPYES